LRTCFDPDRLERYVRELWAGKVVLKRDGEKTRARPIKRLREVAMAEWLDGFMKAG
jgi:hypothetical protein